MSRLRFRLLRLSDVALVCEAWLSLAAARLLLTFMPFRRLSTRLGEHKAETPSGHNAEHTHRLARVRSAVRRASRNAPWSATCLEQAITAKLMLRRRGVASTLYLGVQSEGGRLSSAHAWLRSGDTIVVGGERVHRFTVVSTHA